MPPCVASLPPLTIFPNLLRLTKASDNTHTRSKFLLASSIAVRLYDGLATKQFSYNPSYFYYILLGISVMLFLGKHLVNLVFSWVFEVDKELRIYDFTIISFYNLLGLFFLVLNIFRICNDFK